MNVEIKKLSEVGGWKMEDGGWRIEKGNRGNGDKLSVNLCDFSVNLSVTFFRPLWNYTENHRGSQRSTEGDKVYIKPFRNT
ncbi:MAG: hypothetical protein NTW10_02655 [Bacteroidetes bacterium]|nr:hypothetical protein [Bacteroidota bacterium]